MDCHVHPDIKKQRMHELISLGKAKLHCFMDEQVNSINEVLFERKNKQGLWVGNTTNFVKVTVESNLDLKNKIKKFKFNHLMEIS